MKHYIIKKKVEAESAEEAITKSKDIPIHEVIFDYEEVSSNKIGFDTE